MGASNGAHIMTLVNSIIGVSILAMPFCYKQCGILLATLILVFSNLMTRLSCHYLLKSAIMTRRRSYELLAFHALGGSGKTVVELSIILLMIGTCIAFFVVMGDLGPAIIGPLLQVDYSAALRPAVLIGLAVFVVLPLGLLRNVDSLSSICTASFMFYLLLVVKVFIESMDNLFSSPWTDEVYFWRPAGLLQCLPIFSMALSCQTQLLEIFDSVQNGTLDKMNSIVKSAVNLCTALYMSVGFLGYIAYYKTSFSGNLLMSFSASQFSEFIKLGFVLSVAVTFPLVIFPCRTSLHSLLFKKVHAPHYELVTGGGNHIPEAQFKCITFFIITSSLIVGLLAPNIEIVLGLLGSTIGVIICILCPPFIFMWISNKATTEKVLARMMCVFGLFIMIMGTYANLYLSDSPTSVEPAQEWKKVDTSILQVPVDEPAKQQEEGKIANIVEEKDIKGLPNVDANNVPKLSQQKSAVAEIAAPSANKMEEKDDKRVEPPIPQDPEARKAPVEQRAASKIDPRENADNKKVISDKKSASQDNEEQNVRQEPEKLSNNSNVAKFEEKIDPVRRPKERNVKKDSRNSKEKSLERKSNVDAAGLNEAQKLAKEQPPLPLLVKAQSESDSKKKVENQRDNVADPPNVVEREKRDLDYVTNLNAPNVAESLEEDIRVSNSFVQKVAENKSADKVCKKDKPTEINAERKGPIQPSTNENVKPVERSLSGSQNVANTSSKRVDDKMKTPAKVIETLDGGADKQFKTAVEMHKEKEKIVEQKQSLIMSPSKLSDPDLLLEHRLYVDEKKPIMMKPGKSVSRELKAIDKEAINGKK